MCVRACVRGCVRAYMRACMRSCVRVSVCGGRGVCLSAHLYASVGRRVNFC